MRVCGVALRMHARSPHTILSAQHMPWPDYPVPAVAVRRAMLGSRPTETMPEYVTSLRGRESVYTVGTGGDMQRGYIVKCVR